MTAVVNPKLHEDLGLLGRVPLQILHAEQLRRFVVGLVRHLRARVDVVPHVVVGQLRRLDRGPPHPLDLLAGCDLAERQVREVGVPEGVFAGQAPREYVYGAHGHEAAVDARVQSGSAAFGALRSCLFASSSVSNAAKRAVYESVLLLRICVDGANVQSVKWGLENV